jgi:DNA (cytosine-5)-methyltransferase 1
MTDTKKPRLLDLFCCSGGAGRGYQLAGFHVTGVDIADYSETYAGDVFIQGDAIEYAREHAHEYDAVHASPPCQSSCTLTKGTNKGMEYLNFIPATRDLFAALTVPTVIENVQGSDLRRDLTLCGEMYGLGVIRHRYFEIERFTMEQPKHVPHRGRVAGYRHGQWYDGPYFAVYGDGGGKGSVAQWQEAMGMDWTGNRRAIAEAIPPAYTRDIGAHLLAAVTVPA